MSVSANINREKETGTIVEKRDRETEKMKTIDKEHIIKKLINTHTTISTMESCTSGMIASVITDTEVMGNENNLYFQFGGCQAVARVSKYEISQVGDEIEFVFMPSKIHFFDKETEVNYL